MKDLQWYARQIGELETLKVKMQAITFESNLTSHSVFEVWNGISNRIEWLRREASARVISVVEQWERELKYQMHHKYSHKYSN